MGICSPSAPEYRLILPFPEELMNFQQIRCTQACSPAPTAFHPGTAPSTPVAVLLSLYYSNQRPTKPKRSSAAQPSATLSHPWRTSRERWQPGELGNAQVCPRADPALGCSCSSSGWTISERQKPSRCLQLRQPSLASASLGG